MVLSLLTTTQLNLKTMYQPEVYIKRTLAGYYVCYSALPRRIVNNRPYQSMSDAMRTAWEAVASYRTRQSTIYVH